MQSYLTMNTRTKFCTYTIRWKIRHYGQDAQLIWWSERGEWKRCQQEWRQLTQTATVCSLSLAYNCCWYSRYSRWSISQSWWVHNIQHHYILTALCWWMLILRALRTTVLQEILD